MSHLILFLAVFTGSVVGHFFLGVVQHVSRRRLMLLEVARAEKQILAIVAAAKEDIDRLEVELVRMSPEAEIDPTEVN